MLALWHKQLNVRERILGVCVCVSSPVRRRAMVVYECASAVVRYVIIPECTPRVRPASEFIASAYTTQGATATTAAAGGYAHQMRVLVVFICVALWCHFCCRVRGLTTWFKEYRYRRRIWARASCGTKTFICYRAPHHI